MPLHARTERGAQRRVKILESARELFISPGYYATSLRDIAGKVGMSHVGLQRHYPTKAEILLALVETSDAFDGTAPVDFSTFVESARHGQRKPEHAALISALAGEASAQHHPAHEALRKRYASWRTRVEYMLTESGAVAADRDVCDEAVRLVAVWDGLQLVEAYAPGSIDPATTLQCYLDLMATPHTAAPTVTRVHVIDLAQARSDNRATAIAKAALTVFGRRGFARASMREVAELAGVGKSTLFHYYASKEELFAATLAWRDQSTGRGLDTTAQTSAYDALFQFTACTRSGIDDEAANAAYIVIACEAAVPNHPAHEHFSDQLRTRRNLLFTLFEPAQQQGTFEADSNARNTADLMAAMWLGLQIQHLYEPETIVTEEHMNGFLTAVLIPEPTEV